MKLTVPKEEVLLILKTKLNDLAIVLSTSIKKTFCKVLRWSRLSIDWVATLESINSPLNSELLYQISVNIIKLQSVGLTKTTTVFAKVI